MQTANVPFVAQLELQYILNNRSVIAAYQSPDD